MNRRDIIERCFRDIGVLSRDEALDPADYADAEKVLDGIFALLPVKDGIKLDFTLDEVPATHFLPLAGLLAARIARGYGPDPASRAPAYATALTELRAVNSPYVRSLDFDGDGEESDKEIADFDRGRFF